MKAFQLAANQSTARHPGGGSPAQLVETEAPPSYQHEREQYGIAQHQVLENGKASPAWLRRQLGNGYNMAASYIERMEQEGWVTAPDHVGRRTVLALRHRDDKTWLSTHVQVMLQTC